MKVRVKVGFVHGGEVHKVGEEFELEYSFSWLVERGFVEPVGETVNAATEPDDGLLASEGLPPLDEPPKKGKRNG